MSRQSAARCGGYRSERAKRRALRRSRYAHRHERHRQQDRTSGAARSGVACEAAPLVLLAHPHLRHRHSEGLGPVSLGDLVGHLGSQHSDITDDGHVYVVQLLGAPPHWPRCVSLDVVVSPEGLTGMGRPPEVLMQEINERFRIAFRERECSGVGSPHDLSSSVHADSLAEQRHVPLRAHAANEDGDRTAVPRPPVRAR